MNFRRSLKKTRASGLYGPHAEHVSSLRRVDYHLLTLASKVRMLETKKPFVGLKNDGSKSAGTTPS